MRKKKKRNIAVVMAAVLSVSGIYLSPDLRTKADAYETVKNENASRLKKNSDKITVREAMFPYMHTGDESAAESNNEGANNYTTWADTVKSYLQEQENGNLQRVEAINGKVVIEKYNKSYEIVEKKQLDYELPIFGGYFCGKEYQFLVFGKDIFSGEITRSYEIIKENASPKPSITPSPVATKEPEKPETTSPVESEKPTESAVPSTADKEKNVGDKYSAIIKKYLDAYDYVKKKQYDKIDSSVNLEYAGGFYDKNCVPVYKIFDFNGDGTKELFVGIKNGKSTVTIYDVYTFKNGKTIQLMKDIGYRAGYCSLRKDGIIADNWSGSAFSFGVIYHRLPKNKTKLTNVVELRYSVSNKNGKTTCKKIVNGKKASISKAQAKKIEKKYSKKLSVTFYKLTGTAVNSVKQGKFIYSGQKKWKVTT